MFSSLHFGAIPSSYDDLMHATYRIRKEHIGPRRDKDENVAEFRNRDAAERALNWLTRRESTDEYRFRVVTAIYFNNSQMDNVDTVQSTAPETTDGFRPAYVTP